MALLTEKFSGKKARPVFRFGEETLEDSLGLGAEGKPAGSLGLTINELGGEAL